MFLEKEEAKGRERETLISYLLYAPQPGIEPEINLLVYKTPFQPTEPLGQGLILYLMMMIF